MSKKLEAVDVAAEGRPWVEEVVARIVSDIAPDADAASTPDMLLVADLGYNSVLLIELAFALEELFGLDRLSEGDAPPIGTVGDLQEYVLSHVDAGLATVPDAATVDGYLDLR
jgi:acyl carrier protein